MFVRSVIWNLKEVETSLETLRHEPILRNQQKTVDAVNKARMRLLSVVEQLQRGAFHRPTNPTERNDRELSALYAGMYQSQSTLIEKLAPILPNGEHTLTSLQTANQVQKECGEVYVPLHGENSSGNWFPLLQLLVAKCRTFIDVSRELIVKLRADGATHQSHQLGLLRSLTERLKTLHDVIRIHQSNLQIVNYTVFAESQLRRALPEILPTMSTKNQRTTGEQR